MIKRSFFGLAKPRLASPPPLGAQQFDIEPIPLPKRATLYVDPARIEGGDIQVEPGETVRTGQRLEAGDTGGCVISPVTGTVVGRSQHEGYLGKTFRTIVFEVSDEDVQDEAFQEVAGDLTPETASRFLTSLPGAPFFGDLLSLRPALRTLIINGMEPDLLVGTNTFILKSRYADLAAGISAMKRLFRGVRILLVVPNDYAAMAVQTGAEGRGIDATYPNTLPRMIVQRVLGQEAPAGKSLEEIGIGFIGAEAVAALGGAVQKGVVPVDKVVTVIDKDHRTRIVQARIGTPVGDVLKALDIQPESGDRLVFGGPMRGQSVFSEETPILADTDAFLVQDKGEVTPYVDRHCVNCGECVRICPARMQVNMLVRLLENSLFEEAVEQYDLLSCVECGLCSFVCIARIPIFQYVMLGKYEYGKMKEAEESHA